MLSELLRKMFAIALLGAATAGCSDAAAPAQRLEQGVLGGEDTGYDHAGVLYVTSEVGNLQGSPVVKIGSGSLVAPNLLVTALHVVSKNPSNVPFTCDDSGNEITGSEGADLGGEVAADKVAVYAGPIPGSTPLARGERIVSTGSDTLCENDLAFVVLGATLDLPHYEIRRDERAEIGDTVTVVGYGAPSGMDVAARTRRDVNVRAVGQWIRTFTVSAGPCEGDSGGPALDEQGRITGVFSSVASDCTSSSSAAKYTDISYFGPLVEQAFEAAGAGSPWSSGEGGQPASAGAAGAAGEPGLPGAGAASGGGGSSSEPAERDAGCSFLPQPARAAVSSWAAALFGCWLLARRLKERA